MKILETTLSMVRTSEQYLEAKKLGFDEEMDDSLKYEYKNDPFSLILSKVSGYADAEYRTKESGIPTSKVFLDSDYLLIGTGIEEFTAIMKKFVENE